MTDDTILLLIITAILAIATLVMYFGIKRSMRKAEDARLRRERALEQLKAEREASWKRMASSTYYKSAPPPNTVQGKVVQKSNGSTYATSPSVSDTGTEDLITSVILNHALSGSVEPSRSSFVADDVSSGSSWSRSSSYSSSSSDDVGSSSSWDSSSGSDSGSSSSWD